MSKARRRPRRSPSPSTRPRNRLDPLPGPVYVVRFIRVDYAEPSVRHRYFRRLRDARYFAARLEADLMPCAIYEQPTTRWVPVPVTDPADPEASPPRAPARTTRRAETETR